MRNKDQDHLVGIFDEELKKIAEEEEEEEKGLKDRHKLNFFPYDSHVLSKTF